jgi:hypothetical protein
MTARSFKPEFAQFDSATIEATITRIQELNERLIGSSKTAGRVALDAYENALTSILDFQAQIADASPLEWVSALAATHAQFIKDVSTAYVKEARDNIK